MHKDQRHRQRYDELVGSSGSPLTPSHRRAESPTATLESAVSGLNLALDPTGRSTEEHGLRLQRVRAQLIQHPCLPALLERYRKMTVWWQQLQHLGNKMVRPKSTKWSKGQVDTVEHLTARLDEYEVENRLALQLVGQLIVSPS